MSIIDKEFGEVKVRRSKMARAVKISVSPSGSLRASIPYYAPEFSVKRLLQQNRDELRQILHERNQKNLYTDGQLLGKSHTLLVRQTSSSDIAVEIEDQYLVVSLPQKTQLESIEAQSAIREVVPKILRKQAKAYLPRRLEYLADQYGFVYDKVTLRHASTRWGSCSSSGTISLNIALMNLPHHLIDYVIIHELCHTRQMNHSSAFWEEVEKYDPNYKKHRTEMKKYSPEI